MNPMCHSKKTQGKWKYAENMYQGFGLIHVTTEKFVVKYKGVSKDENGAVQIHDLFEVTINNEKVIE